MLYLLLSCHPRTSIQQFGEGDDDFPKAIRNVLNMVTKSKSIKQSLKEVKLDLFDCMMEPIIPE